MGGSDDTDDFSIKVLGKGIRNRPGLFLELRSHFLHSHPVAEQAEATARKALENLASFVAAHGTNPVIEEWYRTADREWRAASTRLATARAERRVSRQLHVTEEDARQYAADLVAHKQEGDVRLRRQF